MLCVAALGETFFSGLVSSMGSMIFSQGPCLPPHPQFPPSGSLFAGEIPAHAQKFLLWNKSGDALLFSCIYLLKIPVNWALGFVEFRQTEIFF